MPIKQTVPTNSGDYLQFGNATTPVAAQVGGYEDSTGNGHLELYTTASGTSTERVRVTSAGNVGVGITPSAWALSQGELQVGKAALYADGSNQGGLTTNVYYNSGWKYIAADYGAQYYQYNGAHIWATATSGSAGAAATLNESVRITAAGVLCVGLSAPISSEKMILTSSGAWTAILNNSNSASTGVNSILSIIPSTAFNTNCSHFAGQTAGVNTWSLYGNGTTSYVSDENLKKNIETTRDGYLEDLSQLRVVKYQWKCNSDDSQKELGLIAQEVEKVFPNLVQEERQLLKDGTYAEPHKVIKGSVFQPILIKCVQELNDLVKEQQELIKQLQADVAALQGAK